MKESRMKNFFTGFSSILNLFPEPPDFDFLKKSNEEKLCSDWENVWKDMNKSMEKLSMEEKEKDLQQTVVENKTDSDKVLENLNTQPFIQPKEVTIQYSFQGPVPDPFTLKKYDEVQAGFANRLLELTENEASHRQTIERDFLQANTNFKKRGQIFGLTVVMTAIIGGCAVSIWQPFAGVFISGFGLAALAAAFIGEQHFKSKSS